MAKTPRRRPADLPFPGPATERELVRLKQALRKHGQLGAQLIAEIDREVGRGVDSMLARLLSDLRRKFE